MVTFKFDLPFIVHRRLEQIFYTIFVFTPGIHLRFCYALFGQKSPKLIRFLDFGSLLLAFIVWTPYFFGGFYEYSFGRMSAGSFGLNAFGLLGMIGMTFFLKEWIQIWKETHNQMANLIVLSLFFGDFLIFFNLPATMGIPLYSFGELQFIPALLISIFIIKLGAIPTLGQATLIGNRVSLMILFLYRFRCPFMF